jgi:hypothetical protein
MSVMVLDAGNSINHQGKDYTRREHGEIAFPHALRQLSESKYEKILVRAHTKENSQDNFRVNGKPNVVGESAECHGVVTPGSGTARYTRA